MPVVEDLVGKQFSRLKVVERAENSKEGRARWRCICECGKEVVVLGKCLRSGHTKSCGCLNRDITRELFVKDLTGHRYERLTVISRGEDYTSPKGEKHVRWICRCDCGNECLVDSNDLVRGHTKSCGCLHQETLSSGYLIHGGRKDRLYGVWANMKDRCYNPNNTHYKYYGERGIAICEEWKDNYACFKEWAYQNGYDDLAPRGECTIDRIDVDGNYSPTNCRWVDMATQSQNRRNVINKKCLTSSKK